jgi:hypothetical protein
MKNKSQTFGNVRELFNCLSKQSESRYVFEYRPHVGNRTQTIYIEPSSSGNTRRDWIAWTPFSDTELAEAKTRVRRAAKDSTGISFRIIDGILRAQVLLEADFPIEVRVRLVRHLGEVADRLEFHHTKGRDSF